MDADALEREWRRIRRRSRWAIAVVAIIAVGLAIPVVAYRFPPSDAVTASDVIYVIGPPTPARIRLEERLRREGVAPAALISVFPEGRFTADAIPACSERAVTCGIALPSTTKGEALMLTRYAAQHPASRVVVITVTPHVPRTRYIFDKCYGGAVSVVGVDESLTFRSWIYQFQYQTAAFVKAWLTPCAQLED